MINLCASAPARIYATLKMQEIPINLIFNHNLNPNITKKKKLKTFPFYLHHRPIFFLKVNFIIQMI